MLFFYRQKKPPKFAISPHFYESDQEKLEMEIIKDKLSVSEFIYHPTRAKCDKGRLSEKSKLPQGKSGKKIKIPSVFLFRGAWGAKHLILALSLLDEGTCAAWEEGTLKSYDSAKTFYFLFYMANYSLLKCSNFLGYFTLLVIYIC